VQQRIEFKLAVLVFHCQRGMAVPYLTRELHHVADMNSRWQLRSASVLELDIPPMCRVTVSDCTFGVTVARVWNGLPSDVITSPSLSVFKQWLKTLLFRCSFDV